MTAAILTLAALLGSDAPDLDRASSGQPAIGLDEHVGAPLPLATPFVDSSGAAVTLAQYAGTKPIVLVLAYARCAMLCSVVLHATGDALAAGPLVPGRDYTPIVVSLDPRETPDEAARRQATLLERIGRPGDRAAWPYLVGTDANIHAVADALGFHYAWDPRTEQYAHPAAIFVLTPAGRVAEYLRGVQFPALDAAITRAGRGELTPSAARDLVACFHFDPALRRHGARIQLFFRLGAGAVFLGLASTVIGLLVWERRRRRRG